MSRLMSVAYTEQPVLDRIKDVTRRAGWLRAKPGDHVTLCRKVMGRRKGEPLVRIVEVELVDVRREPLRALTDDLDYGFAETTREGFPDGHPCHFPSEFVDRFFVRAQRMRPDDVVTRIEWRYLDQPAPVVGHSVIDVPEVPCGRTGCRTAHDWVGGRCPGNAPRVVVNVADLAAEARAALREGSTR